MSPFSPSLKRSIRWLLEEKYSYSPIEISDFFQKQQINQPKTIIKDINRIIQGEPIAYVIGHIKFLNCHIDLSLKPLIPRPETEYWLGKVIDSLNPKKPISILDLCCGSGCLGIAILKFFSENHVDFIDISPKAIDQTQKNLFLNNINPNCYRLFQSDLFSSLPLNKYDLIITNPPYVDPKKPFDKNLKFEPKIALFTSKSGLFNIFQILDNFQQYLKQQGLLYLEFGAGQKTAINTYCQTKKLSPTFFKDQFKRYRYLNLTHTSVSL